MTTIIDKLPPSLVARLEAKPEDMEKAAAAVLAAFPEEARGVEEARAHLRARALKQAEALRELFAQWAEEDATDDPEELQRRDEEALELRRAMNETRRINGERLHFPDLEEDDDRTEAA